jgi:hypothetical protein
MEDHWGTAPEHAVIYVPADITDPAEFAAIAAPCLERVEACHYAFAGIVRTWPDCWNLMRDGRAQVVIVASRTQLPHDQRPRIETVTDPVRSEPAPRCVAPSDVTAPRVRRPRRVT